MLYCERVGRIEPAGVTFATIVFDFVPRCRNDKALWA